MLRIGRFKLEIRQSTPAWMGIIILASAVAFGALVSVAILLSAGVGLSDLFDTFVVGNLSNAEDRTAVLLQTAPLLLVGLSATMAFRVRFWNIGIEGQMIFGGIGATAVKIYGIGSVAMHLPIMIMFGALGGAAWALIPGFMKYRFGVNEIIWTLLSNYIALYFLYQLLFGSWHDPNVFYPQSSLFVSSERFGKISGGVPEEILLGIAVLAVFAWIIRWSKAGFYMQFVEANDRMSKAIELPVNAISMSAVALSGAAAGLAGLVVASQEGRLTSNFVSGYGFAGILIAFLSRNNPIVVGQIAFLIAMLFDAGRSLQVFDQIPFSMVQLIQGIIVMSVAASEFFIRYRLRWSPRRSL
jgi:general nucleoside transport system permease protein